MPICGNSEVEHSTGRPRFSGKPLYTSHWPIKVKWEALRTDQLYVSVISGTQRLGEGALTFLDPSRVTH